MANPINLNATRDAQLLPKHQAIVDQIRRYCGDVSGQRVLELGSDSRGELATALRQRLAVSEVVGVNPSVSTLLVGDGWQIHGLDARRLPFKADSFDLVVSAAAFEHFNDLPMALQQAYHVLRRGGLLISTFGPIWSGCWGHHLWIQHQGNSYTYRNTNLPPYSHLLMERDEMRTWWRQRYDEKLADFATAFIFDSQEQNRLFFDDYKNIFLGSNFIVGDFFGATNAEKRADYDEAELAAALSAVQCRYSDHYGFEFDRIVVALEKT